MTYKHITVPADGEKIRINTDNSLQVPNRPVIPFIEGDGTGIDITPVMRDVVDAVVKAAAYGGARYSTSTPACRSYNRIRCLRS